MNLKTGNKHVLLNMSSGHYPLLCGILNCKFGVLVIEEGQSLNLPMTHSNAHLFFNN